MFPPCRILPATCELCGNWLPDHQASCPRNGVHPSQWNFDKTIPCNQMEYLLDQQQDDDDDVDKVSVCNKSRQIVHPTTTTIH
ncbi:unnamed protein product [Absidia cylindrospora]